MTQQWAPSSKAGPDDCALPAPMSFGRIYVAPILTEFLDLHESVSAEVIMLDRVGESGRRGF